MIEESPARGRAVGTGEERLGQRQPDALGHAAEYLARRTLVVDEGADVVNGTHSRDGDRAGPGVNEDLRKLRSGD